MNDIIILFRVVFPGKLSSELEADYQQKIMMKFTLKDLAGSATTVHQVTLLPIFNFNIN